MKDMFALAIDEAMEETMDRYKAGGVRQRIVRGFGRRTLLAGIACLCVSSPARAQFSSGSTGVNGSFPPLPVGVSAIPTGTQYLIWNMSTGLVRYCSQYDTVNSPETCTTETGTGQISGIPLGGLTTGVFNFTNV